MSQTPSQGLLHYRRSVTERKRADVVRAARKVFMTEGFGKAAVSDIARQADVSTATLYKYFDSKEHLFDEVVRDACVAVEEDTEQIIDGCAEAMFAFLKDTILWHSSQNASDLFRIARAEVPESAEFARNFLERQLQYRHAELRRLLDTLVERGDLAPHDTDIGASQINGMVKEALIWPGIYKVAQELPADADEIIREAVKTYLARFARQAPSKLAQRKTPMEAWGG